MSSEIYGEMHIDVQAALWQLTAAELTQGYRARRFSPTEVALSCFDRIDACQPVLNLMVSIDREAALVAASAATARWHAATPLSSLDGVPLTIKDNLHVRGMRTTWGSRLLNNYVAANDELPVARLRDAGAVFLGKTNLPEFAMQGYTSNEVSGTTRNPWNPLLTPGGSSGGAAAAVAAGCGPLALATDGGGSIRRPASHCGLVGFKPSQSRVQRGGGLPEIFLDYEVVGGLSRTVGDMRTLLSILAADPLQASMQQSARILFVPQFGEQPVDDRIAAQIETSAFQLAKLGHQIDRPGAFSLSDDINRQWSSMSEAGLAWMMNDGRIHGLLQDALPAGVDWPRLCGAAAQETLRQGRAQSAVALFDLFDAVRRLRLQLHDVFRDYDFILTPATAALPWPAEESYPTRINGLEVGPRGHAVFTAMANAAGLPAIALPTGFVDGLPTGLQLIGRPGEDKELLALAQQYEEACPWSSGESRIWPSMR